MLRLSTSAARVHPALARGFASARPALAPSKDHHIINYPAEAFPKGYLVSATHCGIKKSGALDIGILASSTERPTAAAASMTRNVFKAAPVTVTTELLSRGKGRAAGFVVNSGCANAVTGKQGLENAWATSNTLTNLLPKHADAPGTGSLVMSTGVIGQNLPINKLTDAIPGLVESLDAAPSAWMDLARAFMTTDTFPKLRARTFALGGREVRMVGIDKGAGMIAPKMGPPQPPHATLLGVIATDAAIEPAALQKALNYAVDRSFNSITVDGDMSTNDTVLVLANGAAVPDLPEISEANTTEFDTFKEELASFAAELAQLVVRDGEGATKFVEVKVTNAPSFDIANKVAKSVANSALFKTAMYGQDANWGRILCAVGYTDIPEGTVDPTKVSVQFIPAGKLKGEAPLKLLKNGEPEPEIDEARASVILAEEDLEVLIDLGAGSAESKVWTCDFSHEYVTINGDYRS
ncbi:Arginine biosynthesis bifunctional protein ArgJ, mitochondrial [Vanrija albida]|uniref:Arginine biosynthesis bifunctional protein ArgJ, mitochondrial n=1 Tax=Vanrija albida TaxID=181172 RepID=A0ABR3QBR4_9TREE